MDIKVEAKPIAEVEADALIVVGFEGAVPSGPFSGLSKELYDAGEFSGKALEIAILHRPAGLKAKRLVLAGAGKPGEFKPSEMRKLSGAMLRALKPKGVRSIVMALDEPFRSDDFAAAAVEGALLGDLEANRYKTDPKKNEKQVASFAVSGGSQAAVERGRVLAEAQNFTRDLANEPANLLTPTGLAESARKMAADYRLECEVLDQDRMRQLGMGALLGVSQGSAEPPAMIILRYKPTAATGSKDHLGLVGKGVTFDTGGISIKPADHMDQMRYDMAGGAAMLGAMRAIAQLKPAIPVTAIIPAVENMPGSRAQRPGDIVTSLAGKTVEVLNTDAEGRMILIDALTYAQRLGCTHLVDAATLTGSIVVALGFVNIGAFTNNQPFLDKLMAAAKAEGEKMWQMPIDEEYKEALKSDFADLHNIGGRPGGSVTAAMFLKDFVNDLPWVHLDIAGTAWLEETKPYMAKGASGVGVRTFVRLAQNW
ncbi:MAG TPA: leucyl aminopeptidase [Bryobacteraceae bacterium]|jgi:leucyl aminopeptidase|nr:leucyl aminopeptidase [Bryobacteraceae bacterium]